VVYASTSLVMLLLVAVLALSARAQPPPSVAEFAPNAVDQIKQAPAEQSSEFGSGEGGGGGSGTSTTTTTTTPSGPSQRAEIDVARVRRCVGDPPRQIEDPQSPPCVPYWQGDNGGSTYKGVDAAEIRIAVPNYDDMKNFYAEMEQFLNTRFEFYGRKIRLLSNQKDASADPAVQRAMAQRADDELHVFASTSFFSDGGFHYHLELAKRKIVTSFFMPMMTEQMLAQYHPYLWQYTPPIDTIAESEGEWICSRLHPGHADHAGDPTMQSKERQWGLILQSFHKDDPITAAPLERGLAKCGIQLAAVYEANNFGDNTTAATNAILKMKQENVTSVVCLCLQLATKTLGQAATNQGYFPEWVLGSFFLLDNNWTARNYSFPAEQRDQSFGLSFFPRQLKVNNYPWRWAATEVNPRTDTGSTGGANSSAFMYGYFRYEDLLLLASGIQMAGPHLTPETFARGLQQTRFPNPDHPNMEGKVGFSPDNGPHSMMEDGTEWWWSETAPSPYPEEGAGTICYVNGGKRYRPGQWPVGPGGLFEGPCDSGA
jgi:hypothetical protein